MIIKNFFRKTTTKIYLLLLIIIFSLTIVLINTSLFLSDSINDVFYKNSLFIVRTEENLFDKLNKNKNIKDLKRCIFFNADYNEDSIIVDSSLALSLNKLSWDEFYISSLDGLIAYNDNSNTLEDNEVLVGLNSLTYLNNKSKFKLYVNGKIYVEFENKKIQLIIKGFYDSGTFGEIKMSSSLYEELLRKDTKYFYTARILNEASAKKILKEYRGYRKKGDYVNLSSFYNEDETRRETALEKYKSYLMVIKFVILMLLIVFSFIFFVVNRNILEDLKVNIFLEKILGYTKAQVRFNLLKRLFLLYALSVCLSELLGIFCSLIMKYIFNLDFMIFNFKVFIILFLFSIFANLLLVLTINNKLNINKRR